MAKLIPFSKAIQKQMGFVNTPKGPMINAAFTKTESKPKAKVEKSDKKVRREAPEVKQAKAFEKQRLEDRGIY